MPNTGFNMNFYEDRNTKVPKRKLESFMPPLIVYSEEKKKLDM